MNPEGTLRSPEELEEEDREAQAAVSTLRSLQQKSAPAHFPPLACRNYKSLSVEAHLGIWSKHRN